MMKFRQIPTAGRVIIVAVAVGVLAIALVACWTSYNAIYRLVADMGLYGDKTNMVFPLLVDAAFLVAELAAILGAIMRTVTRSEEVSPGWPVFLMVLCGLGTIAFNVAHAYLLSPAGWADPLTKWRCMVAVLPPLLMILSFQVLIAIVKWVMLRLGRPEQAFGGAGVFPGVAPMGVQMPMPSATPLEMGRNGHPGGGGEASKKAAILAVADQLGTEELTAIGPHGVTEHLAEYHGITTSPNYVRNVLSESGHMTGRNGHGKP